MITFPTGRAEITIKAENELQIVAAKQLCSTLVEASRVGGFIRTPRSLHAYASTARTFLKFLQNDPRVCQCEKLEDLSSNAVMEFEEWCARHYGADSTTVEYRVAGILSLLEIAHKLAINHRVDLRRKARGRSKKKQNSVPHEPYSQTETNALITFLETKWKATLERLTIEGPRILSEGLDPRKDGWEFDRNLVWEIHGKGTVSAQDIIDATGHHVIWDLYNGRLTKLHHLLYPSSADLIAPALLLSLLRGLEPESVWCLSVNCIKNEQRGEVEIEYVKRRAHGDPWKRVKGLLKPGLSSGRIIKDVIRITTHARNFTGNESLWQFYGAGKLCYARWSVRQATLIRSAHGYFDGLLDDQGNPLVVHATRLRKTFKSWEYTTKKGKLSEFARGHTVDVAALHYANVEAHRNTHEAAIDAALDDLVQGVQRPIVLNTEDESKALSSDAIAQETVGIPAIQLKELLNGESNLWLSTCKGFRSSPFAAKGRPCPVPYFGCVECGNAVITTRKLPALLAFLTHMIQKRHSMSEATWAEVFSRPWEIIVHQIIPSFSENEISRAINEAEVSCDVLAFLPEGVSAPKL